MKAKRLRVTILVLVMSATIASTLNTSPRPTAASPDSRPKVPDASQARAREWGSAGPAFLDVTDHFSAAETEGAFGEISADLRSALGISRPAKRRNRTTAVAQSLKNSLKNRGVRRGSSTNQPQVGQPLVLNAKSALSAALITTLGGRDNQLSEVSLLADWDGREDCVADHSAKVHDFSAVEAETDFTLTRTAVSEHTIANGFNENIFYYGDSIGNLWIGTDRDGDGRVDGVQQIDLPALVRAASGSTSVDIGGASIPASGFPAGDCTDDQITVTGIAVNPVADLGDFGLCGAVGEIVYVATLDTEGCASNELNQPIRTRVFCFGLADCRTVCGTVTAFTPATPTAGGSIVIGGTQTFLIGPGVVLRNQALITVGANICLCSVPTTAGAFAVGGVSLAPAIDTDIAPVGVRQILRNSLSNIAGVAVDDDSNLYFQLVDLVDLQNGGAVFKVAETPRLVEGCGLDLRINRVIASIPNGLTGNLGLGSAAGSTISPVLTSNGFRLTNYSGQSATFGNIVSIATGLGNVVYAAVARSFSLADGSSAQTTEGAFANPAALGPTPSMIISFADCSGGFDSCTSPAPGIPGTLPVGDGFADVAQSGLTRIPGVNNFRVFVLGNGPDLRPVPGGTSIVLGTSASVLKLDMQIDFTIHSGLAVNEEGTVFVVSGGTPSGVGKNPSPGLGEILCFEDRCPKDRRADFVDFRGDVPPNPPESGGNLGDGDSDRFDHIFHQAPLDQVTLTPTGLAGLARGFLRYTNRLAPNPISPGVTLGVIGGQPIQSDDDTAGPIIFENLDPGHQAAGGDNQNPPFTGDDSDGVANPNNPNNPVLTGPLSGGFEFLFGAAGVPGSEATPCFNNVWNAFFLNSNGSITFNGGDKDDTPSVPEFRAGLAKIAPAWADLNPDARAGNSSNFPAQALGFGGVNGFVIRWLNVPERGSEGCSSNEFGIGGNTFVLTLYDDGTGLDENVAQTTLANDTDCRKQLIQCLLDEFTLEDVCIDLYRRCSGTTTAIVEGPTAFRYTSFLDGLFDGAVTGDCDNSGLGGICADNGCRRKSQNKAACDTATCGCSNKDIVASSLVSPDTGPFLFSYGRMDLLGTPEHPVIAGWSEGGASPLNPPGLCETNLGLAAARADTAPFGVIDGQIASIEPCLIGEGTEPHILELFNNGLPSRISTNGEITFATPDFDLRFEGNDPALCAPIRQRDSNRGTVGFFGKTCSVSPIATQVLPRGSRAVAPGQPAIGSQEAGSVRNASGDKIATPTSGIVNAVCSVHLSILGSGFYPNETTTICQGFSTQTGVPLQRPGKTVTTTAAITCDTNGDGMADAMIQLTDVTPVNRNLVRATLSPLSATGLTGSAFPLACCGGLADLTLATAFTAGDNNQFGAFARTTTIPIDLGLRAPVVISVTPTGGDCSAAQDVLISGACFMSAQGNVTSVFAVDRANPANVIQATNFVVLSPNLIDALFNFGSAGAGKTFLIFVVGPGGTSRNLTALPQGAPSGCPLGNEQGVQVGVVCDPIIVVSDRPIVSACKLERNPSGTFLLVVTGSNFDRGATVVVGGKSPKKIRFKDPEKASNTFATLVLKGNVCGGIPGPIVVTNPGGRSSLLLQCVERCPQQN